MCYLVRAVVPFALVLGFCLSCPAVSGAEVRAWQGTITIPTYPWEDDINPKFWALEGGAKLSTTIQGAIVYPYTMQDHLSRKKVNRTYKALFLENEYLKVTCLPELGGRIHSVFDKTTGKEMFYFNHVIKPGMIAMRGAWIAGGIEWNAGPHGHTVTAVSPVTAFCQPDDPNSPFSDGSASIEISNLEKLFGTRWTVRVTLRPGRACLDEQISIENPTDGTHPYYFWNCTAFPNRPGTRFIYPMSLGTDHNAREFFRWPIDKGRDLTWLKNYETYASVFAVDCRYDFFGAYDVEADRGIVQVANHHELPGKKAWTWGEWEFGHVAQKNLTDEDGPYIEVQSGPLPTQSDYGLLGPREEVHWSESWYPVHGLGDGFEYATNDLAVQTVRKDGKLEIRLLATAEFPQSVCTVALEGRELLKKAIALSPKAAQVVTLAKNPQKPVRITVTAGEDRILADYTSPLPIPKTDPPDPKKFIEKPDDQLTVEELYIKGRKFDRETDRPGARRYYEKALARDPGHVASLRGLAVLDFEAGLYEKAIPHLKKALDRDNDDGPSWFYLAACHFRLEAFDNAARCASKALRHTASRDAARSLLARASARARGHEQRPELLRADGGIVSFAMESDPIIRDTCFWPDAISDMYLPYICGLNRESLPQYARDVRPLLGEPDFQLVEASFRCAEVGLFSQAERILKSSCVDGVPPGQRSPLPIYWLAWYAHKQNKEKQSAEYLALAAKTYKEKEFASRAEEVPVLKYAIARNPGDGQAHFQLGCLLAHLGRVDEAVPEWEKAVQSSTPSPPAPLPQAGEGSKKPPALPAQAGEGRFASIAWRNLGLAAAAKENNLPKAEGLFRKAITARPGDQTLYRDLAEILLAMNRRPEAIGLMETMPVEGMRRAEITVMLAHAYVDEKRWDDCIRLLESTPYFVNWEGQDVTWRLFNRAHVERGRQRLEKKETARALADFEAALTYPMYLNVGRSNKPEEAAAQFWRGKALAALGRHDEAKAAWKLGAEGADVQGTQNEHRQKCREALGQK
jgi:tetratricopeptide (TPR) repeat protein